MSYVPPPRRPTWLAILAGLITDVGGTAVFSVVLSVVIAIAAGDQQNFERIVAQPSVALFGFVLGSAFTVLGGYVCAYVANHLEYWHGLYLGVASLISSELMGISSNADISLGLHAIYLIVPVPLAIYGAHLRAKQKRAAQ